MSEVKYIPKKKKKSRDLRQKTNPPRNEMKEWREMNKMEIN